MKHDTYGTSDIVLAATLKMHGCKLDHISITSLPSGAKRGVFHFEDVEESDLIAFDSGRFSVEPISFNGEVRALNAAIKRLTGTK